MEISQETTVQRIKLRVIKLDVEFRGVKEQALARGLVWIHKIQLTHNTWMLAKTPSGMEQKRFATGAIATTQKATSKAIWSGSVAMEMTAANGFIPPA